MTNNQLTEEVLHGIYTVAVSGEIAEKKEEPMSAFDLLCAADAVGGIAHLVRKLIDELRADRAELQERRKASMDSKQVAWLAIYHGEVYDEAIGITRSVVEAQADRFGWESALTEIIPLYRHAQPAPVVLKDHQIRELVNQLRDIAIEYHGTQQLRERIARVLRAAMLQAEPVMTANKLGNSPVIPDGLIAAVNRLLDSDGSRGCYSAIQCSDAHDEIERLLAAAPQEVKTERKK